MEPVRRRNRKNLVTAAWMIAAILVASTISGVGSSMGPTGEAIADVVVSVAAVVVVLVVPPLRAHFREMLGLPSRRPS